MKNIPAILLFLQLCSMPTLSQNIGIGTSTPTLGRLQVNGSIGKTVAIFGGDGAGISLMRNAPAIGFNLYNNTNFTTLANYPSLVQSFDQATGLMSFNFLATTPANTTPTVSYGRFTLSANGNMSINGNAENASLTVHRHPASIPSTLEIEGTGNTSSYFMFGDDEVTAVNGGAVNGVLLLNDVPNVGNIFFGANKGKTGINRTNPTAALEIGQVNNRGFILVNPNSWANWELAVYKNADYNGSDLYLFFNEAYRGNFFHRDGRYYKLSDARFKTDVRPLKSLLPSIMQLKPLEYHYLGNAASDPKSKGFIAQDVQKLFPELISVHNEENNGHINTTNVLMMKYDDMGPIEIKAIQEQQQLIRELREKNNLLKRRIEKVAQYLDQYESGK